MKVTLYDNNPGTGTMNRFLKLAWFLGCWFQKLIGVVDDYHPIDSWEETKVWLAARGPLEVVQYWGHGSVGTVWLAEKPLIVDEWLSLKPLMTPNSLLWFRTCNTFKGRGGYAFSKILANGLNCTIAGHTRIIGIFQGGLYTRKPFTDPSWDVAEGGEPSKLREDFKFWNKHTIFCMRTSIPKDW